ncbi:hypothetical protein [Bacillus cereus]|uniref:hypothetical protein n=1 Tax=Bacillus cereus TaxID=1396 RepID=UPI000B612566|nr:hypothetical protein [Bacillus cereus]ASL62716.1 hypothetical protein FORC47_p364 [Bacillus cereus]
MIDYRANAFILEKFHQSISVANLQDSSLLKKRDKTVNDLANSQDYALLGSFVYHLFAHAESDGVEISLLERATDLWKRGLQLYNTFADIRKKLEDSLENPNNPKAVANFNKAILDLNKVGKTIRSIYTESMLLKNDISPIPYLPPHPRQKDKPSASWDWMNLLLGRRTEAFVRNIFNHASDSPTNAFANGVLASYAGNAAGSAYLGHSVGGPRRNHRYRYRLARNTVGSWFAENHPNIGTLKSLSQQLRFGHPAKPSLPPNIIIQLQSAISDTFDMTKSLPLPDLETGYTRMLKHLELLDKFVMPPLPKLPSGKWIEKIYSDPSNLPQPIMPQNVGVIGSYELGINTLPGTNQAGSNQIGTSESPQTSENFCEKLLRFLLIIDPIVNGITAYECLSDIFDGKHCNYFVKNGQVVDSILKKIKGPDDLPPNNPNNPVAINKSQLVAMANNDQMVQIIYQFYNLHNHLWEIMYSAYEYLAKYGLIYPDTLLNLKAYKQFIKIPETRSYPHRSEIKMDNNYVMYPSSPIENPAQIASTYSIGSSPEVFSGSQGPAISIAMQLWSGLNMENEGTNLDLDADRGFNHPCWTSDNSIHDDPVNVVILSYKEQ